MNDQDRPEMQGVTSSSVSAIGYNETKQELWVEWDSGTTSVYSSVPHGVFQDLQNAPSKGKYLQANVKRHYQHRYEQ